MGKHPTDRGTLGTQRSVLTDGGGGPIGLAVDGANRNDVKLTRATSASIAVERPEPTDDTPQGRWLAQGSDEDEVRELRTALGLTAPSRARGEAAQALQQETGFKARRWVGERTHSGMHRFRRMLMRWEKKVRHYLGVLHLACAYITYRRSGLLG